MRGRRSRCFLLLCLRPSTSKKKNTNAASSGASSPKPSSLPPTLSARTASSTRRATRTGTAARGDRLHCGPPTRSSGGGGGARDTNLARMMAGLSDPRRGKRAAFCSSEAAAAVSREWDARATGCPLRDYDLLHRVSVSEPEFFWPRRFGGCGSSFATAPLAALGRGGGASPSPSSPFLFS